MNQLGPKATLAGRRRCRQPGHGHRTAQTRRAQGRGQHVASLGWHYFSMMSFICVCMYLCM